jgi:hypothetical protein
MNAGPEALVYVRAMRRAPERRLELMERYGAFNAFMPP